jgi:uncharacterized protein (TIGR02453 family)
VAGRTYFTRDTFRFLRDLKENNDRDWFAENKHRYEEELKAPALRLIEDFGQRLPDLSEHFKATPRSLFRIYRDVRFSKDKSPYKTAVGIQFRHEQAKDAYAPGFYFHVAPGDVFAGLGVWHPPSKALRAIRDHIVDDPDAWTAASGDEGFADTFSLEGDSLKRAPKGFDPEHPLIEDLRRKDFIGVASLTQAFATSPELPDALAKLYGRGMPLMRFLGDALNVPI